VRFHGLKIALVVIPAPTGFPAEGVALQVTLTGTYVVRILQLLLIRIWPLRAQSLPLKFEYCVKQAFEECPRLVWNFSFAFHGSGESATPEASLAVVKAFWKKPWYAGMPMPTYSCSGAATNLP